MLNGDSHDSKKEIPHKPHGAPLDMMDLFPFFLDPTLVK